MTPVRWGTAVLAAGILVATAPPLAAQGLEGRVRASDGQVAFHFAVREGVEVCENGIVTRPGRTRWSWRGDEEQARCSTGLAEIVLTVREGSVRRVELEPWEGPGSTPAGIRSLGRAAAPEAADVLLSLARSGRDRTDAAEAGLSAAALADSVDVWPRLLAVARDRSLDGDIRRTSLFWVGQAAGDVVTADLVELAGDEEQEVRDAAVFALSRRPDDEGVPALMELARTAREARTRRSAMFWLARSRDERVLAFFEKVLLGGPGG